MAAAAARVERQLWEGKEAGEAEGSEQDAAEAEVAREARLAKIQAK